MDPKLGQVAPRALADLARANDYEAPQRGDSGAASGT
jgi:hypothetical protein